MRTKERWEISIGVGEEQMYVWRKTICTYRVIFQHSHHGRRSRPLEGVEEAGHGHGDEPDVDQSCLCCEDISNCLLFNSHGMKDSTAV